MSWENSGKGLGSPGRKRREAKEMEKKDKGHARSRYNRGHHTLILRRMEMAKESPPPQDFPTTWRVTSESWTTFLFLIRSLLMKVSIPFQMWFKQTTGLLSADAHVVKPLLPPALITSGNGFLSPLLQDPWGASPSGKDAGNTAQEAAGQG